MSNEKPSFKDIYNTPSTSVDAAFDPEKRQAEKDWAHFLDNRPRLVEHDDGKITARDAKNRFMKTNESDFEYTGRLQQESLESTSRDSMGLVSLAKAGREAIEHGDKTTQINIEDEIQERLIAEAEKNGWTDEQTSGMLDRLLNVMHGESDSAVTPENEGVISVEAEPASATDSEEDEDVIALPGPKEAQNSQPEETKDASDEEATSAPAADLDNSKRVPLERSLVPVEESPLAQYEARTQYWSENGIHASDPNRVALTKEGDESVDLGDWLDIDDDVSSAENLSEEEKELFKDYKLARDEYVAAQAGARFADLGSVVSKFAKKGGWLNKVQMSLGEAFNTSGHKRRIAREKFEGLYVDFRNTVLGKEADDLARLDFDADAAWQLEYDISTLKMNNEKKKSPLSRKVSRFAGLTVAAGAGAMLAAIEEYNRNGHQAGGAILSAFAGAGIGYYLEKKSRDGLDEEAILGRADMAHKEVRDFAKNGVSAEESPAINITEYLTNEAQDRNLKRVTRAAGAGAIAATAGHYVPHLGADIVAGTDLGIDLNRYDGEGTDLNPFDGDGVDVWDGDGTDLNPFDGDGIDVFPEGDYEAPTDLTGDNGEQDPVGPAGDSDGDGIDEPMGEQEDTGAEENEFDGTDIDVQPGSSITQEFQEYVRDEYGITLSDAQARDMYTDFMKEASPTDIFSGAEFYEMDADPANGIEQGDWGIKDTGPAEITPAGEAAIEDWLQDKKLLPRGV